MSAEVIREKRDLVLPPGSYAYMQDVTKGVIKTYTGPTVINPTAQEVPVVYDAKDGGFKRAIGLEEAVRKSPVAVEGFYIALLNPARGNKHPEDGTAQPSAELDVGRKVNIPGPAMFPLWPGQAAEVVRGHHLRSNQYLLVRVYNEDEARKNWTKAVVKPATDPGNTETVRIGDQGGKEGAASSFAPPIVAAPPPADLTVGKMLIIRGTEVSFYIPPTGITVMQDGLDGQGKTKYVRDAMTLERLEYCILVEENGKKRYETGPKVVFPLPSERFVEGRDDNGAQTRKFRAIELNAIQGLHVKVIAPYEEDGKHHEVGEEIFITGKDTAIYFPREEHSAIKYDGKSKHFATAVPAGEARYVLNRLTGEIKTARGPAMLLPDPRSEVIVRRVLSDRQAGLWYPGNVEALKYNQQLQAVLQSVPTTRSGAVSEGDISRGVARSPKGGFIATSNALMMDTSRVSGDQGLVGDEFSRASSYTQPRTVTLDTKFQGAPTIEVWTGYAVQVVSKTGKRRVEKGPTTILMEYDESLEILELSTGKPKTTDNLLKTVYLRVENNKVSDVVTVETADHVVCKLYLSYRVNFEGDPTKWFQVENYVKFLCDHVRSVLKGAIKKVRVEEFYANSVDLLRDTIIGKLESGKRTGMPFVENGMRVIDVEVLGVELTDPKIRELLDHAQHEVVRTNIDLSVVRRNLEVTKQKEEIAREDAEAKAETAMRVHRLAIEVAESELALILSRAANQIKDLTEQQNVVTEREKVASVSHQMKLDRARQESDQNHTFASRDQELRVLMLKAEVEAVVERFKVALPGFSEALLAMSNNETLVKVAEAWNIQRALGGENVSDALRRVFEGTPLGPIVGKLTAVKPNGASERPMA